jgi:hypothetical protein
VWTSHHDGIWASGGIAPSFLISLLDGGEWSPSHFSALPPPPHVLVGWALGPVWTLWCREKFFTRTGNRTPAVYPAENTIQLKKSIQYHENVSVLSVTLRFELCSEVVFWNWYVWRNVRRWSALQSMPQSHPTRPSVAYRLLVWEFKSKRNKVLKNGNSAHKASLLL